MDLRKKQKEKKEIFSQWLVDWLEKRGYLWAFKC